MLHTATVRSPVAAEQKYWSLEDRLITGVAWPVHFPNRAPVVLSAMTIELPPKSTRPSPSHATLDTGNLVGEAHCANSFPDLESSTTALPDPVISIKFLSTLTILDTAP